MAANPPAKGSVADQPASCPKCGRMLTYAVNKENGVVIPLDQIIPVYQATRNSDGSISCVRDLNAMPNHYSVCGGAMLTNRRRRMRDGGAKQ